MKLTLQDRGKIDISDDGTIRVSSESQSQINSALDCLRDKVFLAGIIVDECHVVYGAEHGKDRDIGQCRLHANEIAPIVEKWDGGTQSPGEGGLAKRLVLFGDERNQSIRRRFTDSGDGVEACDGCKTQRLSCWMSKMLRSGLTASSRTLMP